ncbi:uncharacterized protein L969DRAFT_19887 [Mixia osmundae IAM 14324]|uniref:uncharacterized protein n=1 Tax=Mixia osmundae (strain CBS 9802 / IAM 14324 / JCM 22182 / KY 12970) TaxID=764103 RepID=UPI0004A552CE|nr:uncharacterized protein L969DRAFT_19887 [Mixia osmundae IAM 14324]KEI36887.1 hypothetical protein L969DRAFT_19887 [Mixia osmundae IAM 14324]
MDQEMKDVACLTRQWDLPTALYPLTPLAIPRWTKFALTKGGIGTAIATRSHLAESEDELMFLADEHIVILTELPSHVRPLSVASTLDEEAQEPRLYYLGYCLGVIGIVDARSIEIQGKLKRPYFTRRAPSTPVILNSTNLHVTPVTEQSDLSLCPSEAASMLASPQCASPEQPAFSKSPEALLPPTRFHELHDSDATAVVTVIAPDEQSFVDLMLADTSDVRRSAAKEIRDEWYLDKLAAEAVDLLRPSTGDFLPALSPLDELLSVTQRQQVHQPAQGLRRCHSFSEVKQSTSSSLALPPRQLKRRSRSFCEQSARCDSARAVSPSSSRCIEPPMFSADISVISTAQTLFQSHEQDTSFDFVHSPTISDGDPSEINAVNFPCVALESKRSLRKSASFRSLLTKRPSFLRTEPASKSHRSSSHKRTGSVASSYVAMNTSKIQNVSKLEQSWLKAIKQSPATTKASRPMRTMTRKGLPSSIRGVVWSYLAETHRFARPGLFDKLDKLPPPLCWSDIEKDLNRSLSARFATTTSVAEGHVDLARVLKAFAHHLPHIGYCQGLGLIVNCFLRQMPAEDAFWLLVALVESYLPDYYSTSMSGIKVDAAILGKLLAKTDPKLACQMAKQKIFLSMFLTPWQLPLFVSILPEETLVRVLDIFFFEGRETLLRVSTALLELNRLDLLDAKSEMLMGLLRPAPGTLKCDILIPAMFAQRWKSSQVRALRKSVTA